MDREQLKTILPHREPMLLLDSCELGVDDDGAPVARGTYRVRGDEFFLQGHFPGNPVVPGVIQCEMIAQNCCVLLADDPALAGATPYYTSLDKVRFKHPVRPGDVIDLTCSLTRAKGPFRFARGQASVDGTVCCTAEFSFALVRQQEGAQEETRRQGAGAGGEGRLTAG